jgi:hypothetical protein
VYKTRGKNPRDITLAHVCAKCDQSGHGAASCP